jgi:tetratricopeptide (TPR) repeat protein
VVDTAMGSDGIRESLLSDIQAYLARLTASQDPSVALDPEALEAARTLLTMMDDLGSDLKVASAVGSIYWYRYLVLGDLETLLMALLCLDQVYRAQPDAVPGTMREYLEADFAGSPHDPGLTAKDAARLLNRAVLDRDRVELNHGVVLLRQLLDVTRADHPGRAALLSILATVLQALYEQTRAIEDLDRTIAAAREAVSAAPVGHPCRGSTLSILAAALHARSEQAGTIEDLDRTIAAAREAAEAAPVGHPGLASTLSILAAALHARSEQTGGIEDLDRAIAAAREATDLTPVGHPSRATKLSELSAALQTRYKRTEALADLDAAIAALGEAADAITVGHPSRAIMLSELSAALQARYERTGAIEDLEAATAARNAATREAVVIPQPGSAL